MKFDRRTFIRELRKLEWFEKLTPIDRLLRLNEIENALFEAASGNDEVLSTKEAGAV